MHIVWINLPIFSDFTSISSARCLRLLGFSGATVNSSSYSCWLNFGFSNIIFNNACIFSVDSEAFFSFFADVLESITLLSGAFPSLSEGLSDKHRAISLKPRLNLNLKISNIFFYMLIIFNHIVQMCCYVIKLRTSLAFREFIYFQIV